MTRPGNRFRAIAARICNQTTMGRVIDPFIADLQTEHGEAIAKRQMWRSRWIRIAGGVAFLKIIMLCGLEGTMQSPSGWTVDDRRVTARTLWFSLAAMVVTTLAITAPFVLFTSSMLRARLMVYLIPSGLGVAIPIGCLLGMLYAARGQAVSRRSMTAVLVFAVVASLSELAAMAWLIPEANQAFRTAVARQYGEYGVTPLKGLNELTLGELSQEIASRLKTMPTERSFRLGELRFAYHQKWAFSGATLALALFAMSMSGRTSQRRVTISIVALVGLTGYYLLLWGARSAALDGIVPVFVGAWLSNVVFLVAAMIISRTRRASGDIHGPVRT